jgi:hypothetical protein
MIEHTECTECGCFVTSGSGGWVSIEDFKELKAENERLRAAMQGAYRVWLVSQENDFDCVVAARMADIINPARQDSCAARDAEIQRLERLSVELREDYLHMMRRVGHVYDLLSGEFFSEALGELHDMIEGRKNGV